MTAKHWQVAAIVGLCVVVVVGTLPFILHYLRGVECGREAASAISTAAGSNLYGERHCECDFFGQLCEIDCRSEGETSKLWVFQCHPPKTLCALSDKTPVLPGVPCCDFADCGATHAR